MTFMIKLLTIVLEAVTLGKKIDLIKIIDKSAKCVLKGGIRTTVEQKNIFAQIADWTWANME